MLILQHSNELWREVLHLAEKEDVPKGHMWKGDNRTSTFSFLANGAIYLHYHTLASQKRVLLQLGPSCLFREVEAFYTGQGHDVYQDVHQEALKPCTVYNFPANLLHDNDFIARYPHLVSNAMATMAEKMGAALQLLSETFKPSPEALVGQFLLDFVEIPPHARTRSGISQGDLAATLGIHRSTVCRVLKDFRNKGVIGNVNSKCIQVFNKEYLHSIVNTNKL
ncbi:MAG: Crp/Fnr family transcriptional regulator [Pseudomonadota bacterium]